MKTLIGFAALSGAALTPAVAFAHAGHIGELAGHSHWVGIAALAGASLVAGVIALKGRKNDSAGNDADAGPVDADKPEAEATS
ncbi:DUF6732 family protein [Roseibium sp. RKSG952]|uniref:DUF6732 family protein n=1 Tax=Roseibium sp. RKSG952 TaxID=2529384 RepID=UPI0012BC79C1|nr:DUF6732 family protein [Roseibium sp. RKSG952]MTI00025.1 hypothetical protein [Roseibium sp. RKSG952]